MKNLLLLIVLLACFSSAFAAENPGPGRSLAIRFPSFSLSPGERVLGVKMKTSKGEVVPSTMPGSWRCEYQENEIHCFGLHQSYALTLTAMLPEIIIRDIPVRTGQIVIEASVELVDGDGREYSRDFRESELIIK
jgi:hypothetical protein